MKYIASALIFCLFSEASFANTLIIGDSHVVGPFGENLHKYFNEVAQENVRTVGLAGGTARSFTDSSAAKRTLSYGFADRQNDRQKIIPGGTKATAPLLSALLDETKPQRLIVELGDNFADYKSPTPQSDKAVVAQVKQITETLTKGKFSGSCYWVTPTWTDKVGSKPYYKSNERLARVISIIKTEVEPRCRVIDSTRDIGVTEKDIRTTADGLHFDAKNGAKWARGVANRIREIEASPATSRAKNPLGTK
ncbi:SGNH/GDSL hydrolase family protein [Bdellovibrio sp. ArHS]|uniref:SGNH/GDSL hydrolase family protein n=1 Tax=Bdellovibrio sp. ArHS TaxID=1569284 RepID=UPI000AF46B00|nr:SGNH/GDSL hydrolase family protein [Bdellovibrio sp. ArHS]